MSVRRRQRWLGSQRIDVPHLRSIESAVSSDFDELLRGWVTGEGRELVVRGFEINMTTAINAAASSLQMLVASSTLFHGSSLESGTFYTVSSSASPETLNSTTNTKVRGSFTPNAINYVGIEYERIADEATADTVYFWNPTNKTEFSSSVPLASILRYTIVITTSIWATNVVPIAKVKVNVSGNVENITDQRPMMFRLGTAGRTTPNPDYVYPWNAHTQGRTEESFTATGLGQNPFRGGDKQIQSLKDWMDAIMSSLKEIKGTTYWYSENTPGSLVKMREDLANTVISGRGLISHDTTIAGKIMWSDDIYFNVIGSQLSYRILANPSPSSNIVLGQDEVAYIKLIRGVEITPNLVFTNGSTSVQSVGGIAWTGLLQSGDWVRLSSDDDTKYLKISSVVDASSVILDQAFTGTSTGASGAKALYAFGTYETNLTPSTDRHIKVALRKNVSFDSDTFWFLYRNDNGGLVPRVYVRFLGSELEQGEDRQISDNTSEQVLQYIGSPSEVDTSPAYVGPTRNVTQSENLTSAINSLDTELDKFFGQLYIKPTLPVSTRVVVTGADRTMLNSNVIGQELAGLLMKFDGAEIDFATGNIYESDGVTPLGINFTPATISSAKYRWYSVSLVPQSLDSSNRLTVQLVVLPASADGVTADAAPRAPFTGVKKIGQVVVHDDGTGGTGTITSITQSQCLQVGLGFGASKAEKPKLVGGGTFSWNSGTNQLSFTQDIYVEQPRLSYVDNTISYSSVSPITLPTTNHVAYIDRLNVSPGGPNLTVSVDLITNVKDHQIIIARRAGSDVLVGTSSTLLKNGQSSELYAQESIQSRNTLRSTDYLRSDSEVYWDGSQFSFPSDIILESLNVRTGALKQTTISSSQSPITIADGQAVILVIDREAPSGAGTLSVVSSVPMITSENQEVIPIARRVDVGANSFLHILLHKQIIEKNQSIRLGQSYKPVAGGDTTYEVALTNNQSSPANIADFSVSYLESKIFKSDFGIARRYFKDAEFVNDGLLNPQVPTFAGTGSYDSNSNNNVVQNVIYLSDGKMLVYGRFTEFNGVSRNRIARLNADGSLDTSFDPGTGCNGSVFAMAIQTDGKILIGGLFTDYNGTSRNRIARINTDGSLDTSFNPGTGFDSTVNAIAIQSDGKIMVGGAFITYNGTTRNNIVRILTDGTIDTGFNPGTGFGNNIVYGILIQSDGKIIAGGIFSTYNGTARSGIARINTDGTIDTSFTPGTGFTSGTGAYVYSIALQSDGKIVAGGSFTGYNGTARSNLVRLTSAGALDTTFTQTGTGLNGSVRAVAIQSDGKIVAGGSFTSYNSPSYSLNYVGRFNSDGTVDIAFSPVGLKINTVPGLYVQGVAIKNTTNYVMVCGSVTGYDYHARSGLCELNSYGLINDQFLSNGFNASVSCNILLPDATVLVGGNFTGYNGASVPYLAKLTSTSSLDTSFTTSTGLDSGVSCAIRQSDGKIVIGGSFTTCGGVSRNRIARLNADGSLDTSFDPGTGCNSSVRAVAIQSDGKIVIVGVFSSYNGTSRNRIARINTDGSLDTSFNPGTGFFSGLGAVVDSVALQSDGKIVAGGSFTSYNGTTRNGIVRINTDGTIDTSFNPGTGIGSTSVYSIGIQSDGKIVIGGSFTSYNGTTRNRIARINTNGSLDSSFTTGTGFDNPVGKILINTSGAILVGGSFSSYNGTTRNGIVRLLSDSTLDSTFGQTGTGLNGSVTSIAQNSNGEVVVGGSFSNYDTQTISYVGILGNYIESITSEYMTRGTLSGIYRPSASTWELNGITYTGDTPEVNLTITNAGQVQYTSSNLPGIQQESKIKFKLSKF